MRADADLDAAVECLVDGAFFNSGQSCCGIERIYVHPRASTTSSSSARSRSTRELPARRSRSRPTTTLGPMVRASAGRLRARPDRRGRRGRRARADRSGGFAGRRAGHALPRAPDPGRRRPRHVGDERGELRTGRRDHAPSIRRRGARA